MANLSPLLFVLSGRAGQFLDIVGRRAVGPVVLGAPLLQRQDPVAESLGTLNERPARPHVEEVVERAEGFGGFALLL